MPTPLGYGWFRSEVSVENSRERVHVVEVEETESRDRHVDLARIDAGAKRSFLGAPLEHLIENRDERGMKGLQGPAVLQMTSAMQVLISKEGDEVPVLIKIIKGELDEALHCLCRGERAQVERAFTLPDLGIDALQNTLVEVVLIAEVVVNQLLVYPGPPGDLGHAGGTLDEPEIRHCIGERT